jgi:ABC-type sugar transport system ATPase subunit
MSYIEVSNFSKSINNEFIIQDINFKLDKARF